MKTLFKTFFSLLLLLSYACKEVPSEEAENFDAKMKETIQVHDDVMPKMGEINSFISKLEAEKEILLESEDDHSEEIELYEGAISNLKQGHDLMMSWMKNFSNSFSRAEINSGLQTKDQDSIQAKTKLLEKQYKSAHEMKSTINEAIENAQRILTE
jgi:hypothetical protein